MQQFSTPQPPPNRGRFRAGLLAGFAIVFILVCAVSFVLLRPELDVRAGPPWTPPAFPTPGEAAGLPPQTAGAAAGLVVGRQAVVSRDVAAVNVRRSPGYLNKPDGDVVATLARETVVDLIGGPQNADALTWWQVRANGIQGWVAETRANGGSLLVPAP